MAIPKISLDRLVDAAVEIAAEEGIHAVTMRRLADVCGVGVMTIYGYVRTKEELLGILADRFLSEIELPDADKAWSGQIADLFGSLRSVMLAHPPLAPIVAEQRIDGLSAYRGAEIVFGALREAGLPDNELLPTFSALTAFTVGSVQRELGAQRVTNLPALGSLPAEDFPHVVSLAGSLLARTPEREFTDGLALLVDGIRARASR